MASSGQYRAPPVLSRRSAVRRLGAIALGLCATGCSRGFVLGILYPEADALDPEALDTLLTAFVATVVPEIDAPERVTQLMRDPALPFAELGPVLGADLVRRTRAAVGHGAFDRLDLTRRTRIVAAGLGNGGVSGRIYSGAVLFAQAAVYGGLASTNGSCTITGFEGRFRFRGYADQTYPDPERFLPAPVSADGNPW